MSDYPAWITVGGEVQHEVEVDWAALPEGWRDSDYRLPLRDEDRAAWANRVRAAVAEGLAPADQLRFADFLIES